MPIYKNGEFISTKSNHMGMGMSILEELADKYDGNLNCDYSEVHFETKIILSITKENIKDSFVL